MTDARLKGEWLTAASHDRLSDQAYRVLHNALMRSAEEGTDGAIDQRDLRWLYPGPIDQAWLDELEAAGFWERTANGYQFIDWAGKLGQSTQAQVETYRSKARERMRKLRATRATSATSASDTGAQSASVSENATGNVRANTDANETENVGVGKGLSEKLHAREHEHEPNARSALAKLRTDLPLDELLTFAYRIGDGDPWQGYLRVKEISNKPRHWANNPAAALRKDLRDAARKAAPDALESTLAGIGAMP